MRAISGVHGFVTQDVDDALIYVRRVVIRSGSSFRLAMRLLPGPQRDAMYAIYAFCREVDDIADEAGEADRQFRQLQEWRAEIERLYVGRPTTPVCVALQRPVATFDLPRQEFLAIIDGMEMDVRGCMCAPSFADLDLYCRRVAVAVGILSLAVMGAHGPQAWDLARALGEALQLTNILRDLREDAARGRLYLPRELLIANGIETTAPAAVLQHPALPQVCRSLADRAHQRFSCAEGLLIGSDRRRLRSCILMMKVYERVLSRLEREGWQDLETTARLPLGQMLWIVLRHGILEGVAS